MFKLTTQMIANREIGINFRDDLIGNEAHTHKFIEIAYTVHGSALHILNGVEERIGAGNYVIIEPGDIHWYKKIGSEKLTLINCIFTPQFLYSQAKSSSFMEVLSNPILNIDKRNLKTAPASHIYFDKDGTILQLFSILKKEYQHKSFNYITVMRNILNTIISLSMRDISNKNQYSSIKIVEYTKDYISIHYAENNLLKTISDNLNYSIQYVSTKFKEVTGENFTAFLIRTRIEIAVDLLLNTNLSIPDIAHLVGYNDMKHFIDIFKRHMKYSPLKYKNIRQKHLDDRENENKVSSKDKTEQ